MKKLITAVLALLLMLTALGGCSKRDKAYLGNVLILGDSFSTFAGHIPEGYKSWYSAENKYAGVDTVEHTWWHLLMTETKSNLLLNSSYSGSTVCNTTYGGKDSSAYSFVTRADELIADGFFKENKVDTVIIYGGLNDCWAAVPRGEPLYEGFTDADLYSFYPALSYLLNAIGKASPDTRILVIIEAQLDGSMKDGIGEVAAHYGAQTIAMPSMDLQGSHPSAEGMRTIADTIVAALREE